MGLKSHLAEEEFKNSSCHCNRPENSPISSTDSSTSSEGLEVSKNENEETVKLKRPNQKRGGGRGKEPLCSPGFITKNGITLELLSQELWKKFHRLGTEMIITKAGR